MPEIIKVYKQTLPATRFVGRCYGEEDKVGNTFSKKWGEWFENNLFAPIEIKCGDKEHFEDSTSYYGLCRCSQDQPFQYWIGVFLPAGAQVPEGYDSIDFDATDIAVYWVKGKEPDIYFVDPTDRMAKDGYKWAPDKDGYMWCFERYACPRFTEPDKDGNVILDLCFFI
ncbi:MAG: hypothetical protein PHW00_06140 [Clostridia bacterium]|nr:hypothetical protein [Clostridia bacterium]